MADNITGKNIKMLRKQKQLTQKELADMLGYGYTAISNYENGRNEPSIKTDMKIKIKELENLLNCL